MLVVTGLNYLFFLRTGNFSPLPNSVSVIYRPQWPPLRCDNTSQGIIRTETLQRGVSSTVSVTSTGYHVFSAQRSASKMFAGTGRRYLTPVYGLWRPFHYPICSTVGPVCFLYAYWITPYVPVRTARWHSSKWNPWKKLWPLSS